MPSWLPCFTSFERCNLDLGHRQVLKGVLLLLLPRPPLRPNDQKHKFPTYVSRKGADEKCMHAPDKLPQSDIHSTPLSAFSNDVREGKNSEGARKKRKGKEGRNASAATGFHFPDHWSRITITGAGAGGREHSTIDRDKSSASVLGDGPAGWNGKWKRSALAHCRAAHRIL